ncbi:MAG: PLP-dependent aminotransferase family protein [Chloroflexaceae bacterium]|nr:PLP-dependent aminotransferase family protein [Chloroflexaceae bacterium]
MALPRSKPRAIPLSGLTLNPEDDTPLHRQLCDRLREAILSGTLRAGTRLPGTRTLATELGISRNTVVNAFEQLLAEGYVTGKIGSGTYVACKLPDTLLQVGNVTDPPKLNDPHGRNLSRRGRMVASAYICEPHDHGPPSAFRLGVPAVSEFPIALWSRLVARYWRQSPAELLSYGSSAGYYPLREAIASYVGPARGVRCTPQQVIIVSGSQQGVDLAARLLLDPGDSVWVETPGYRGARAALQGAGARPIPVPVDEQGLVVEVGQQREPYARLAYVSPSHQYPTGAVMSLPRRLQLLEWADQADAWVLEDDYDSEYRYSGRPISALQGLDRSERVIYIGTFSKVLLPTLRLGYLIVPPDMAGAFANARKIADIHSPLVDQAVLTDFINEGHFSHHLRRMRTLYAERQRVLLEAARQALDGVLTINHNETGMHVVAWLPAGVSDQAVCEHLLLHGIYTRALSSDCLEPIPRGGLLLGYAALTPEQIWAGVQRMREVLAACPALQAG